MLSDVHFDPMRDPDKVPLLAKAPVNEWRAIFESAESPNQRRRFASIQAACGSKEGADSSYSMFRSGLRAARAQASSPAFVMVSGDLLVHDLDCRYRSAMGMPPSTQDDQSASAAFAEKTTVFVMEQIEAAFPGIPVYIALGNNDSRCNHNRLDSHDAYLKASTNALIAGLRGVSVKEKVRVAKTYAAGGYYSVKMVSPMRNTRLIVIDNLYMIPKYANCEADDTDLKGEHEQLLWLRQELTKAHESHERVWVLGHLPPSVNPDASLSGKVPLCKGGNVVRFQATEDLADQLTENAGEIRLGIFGHTHMDEVHLLQAESGGVPIKVVGSLSPVSGNLPSFTIGRVNTRTSTLADFTVYEASNKTGVDMEWSKEYSFDAAYGEADFTPAPISDLIRKLRADTAGNGPDSREYQTHFFKGGTNAKKLSPSWQGYVCGMDHATATGFTQCVCETR